MSKVLTEATEHYVINDGERYDAIGNKSKPRGQIVIGNTTYDVTEDYYGGDEPTFTLHGPKSDFILRGFTNRDNVYAVISWPNGNEKRIKGNRVLVRFDEAGKLEVMK